MNRWIFGLLLLTIGSAALPARAADDQDRVNAAYARLHAKQTAATQPATITNAELQSLLSEVTALRAENDRLRELLAKAAVAIRDAAPPPAQQPAAPGADAKIAEAMAQHTLADGMTIAQAEKSLSLQFQPTNEENSDGQDYTAVADRHQLPFKNIGGMVTGGQMVGIQYKIHVKDGIVTYWSKSNFSLEMGNFAGR